MFGPMRCYRSLRAKGLFASFMEINYGLGDKLSELIDEL
jgi:hypothetical protein